MPKYKITLKPGSVTTRIPLQHHFQHDKDGNVTGVTSPVKTMELEHNKPVVLDIDKYLAWDLHLDPRLDVKEQGGAEEVEETEEPEHKKKSRR